MKKLLEHKKLAVLSAAALFLTAALSIGNASAYFTTYVSAGGSHPVNLGARTELRENVSEMTKHIFIENTSQINDCYVRVKVFYAGPFEIEYTDRSESGSLWTYSEADGYWYYGEILPPRPEGTEEESTVGITAVLDAKINLPEGFDQDSFNVVVIQECTPVIYDENGNPTADWNTVYTDYQETEQGEGAD